VNLAQRTLKGIFWAYTSNLGGQVLTLITTTILGRLLVPDDFGLVAFALIFMAFIEAARGFGVNDALIYTSERVEDTADTVFIINVVLGFVQFTIAFLLAPLLIHFIEDPRIVPVTQMLALLTIINGLTQTHDAMLQKELEFRRRFLPDVISVLIKGVISISMALLNFGVWSIVFGTLAGSISRTIAKWFLLKWRPRLRFYADRARAMWNYGIHVLMSHLLDLLLENADQLLIGVLLGQLQLGYYTIAMKIPEMIISNLSLMLTRVLFPTYARMKSDLAQLTAGFVATTRYTSFVTVPIGLGICAVAPEMVIVVFGKQWEPSIPLVQVLALMQVMLSLPWSAGDVLKAIGRPDISTKLLIIEVLVTFPVIVLLVTSTRLPVMAAVANLIGLTFSAILRLSVITRFVALRPIDFFHIFKVPFFSGFIMFVCVTGWRMLVSGWSIEIILITSVLVGVISYTIPMWLLERKTLLEAYEMLRNTIKAKNLRAVENPENTA
jgi:PST family polysaccharide transporter